MTDELGPKPDTRQKIEKLYAWIAPDGAGEGVLATTMANGRWMPLIGADRERIESFREVAQEATRETGKTVYLKVFSFGVVIDKINPPAAEVAPSEPSATVPWTSQSCVGERCTMCGQPAAAKVGEEILWDDPFPGRHNLTAYVCADHFEQIMGLKRWKKRPRASE